MSSLKKAADAAMKKCLELKSGEKCLIVYDKAKKEIADSLLESSKLIGSDTKLLEVKEPSVPGEEPHESVGKEMLDHDVVMLVTSKSLSHTKARRCATEKGCRIASMPGIDKEMFVRTMEADYEKVHERSNKLAEILTNGKKVTVTTELGTNITMDISGRKSDAGALIKEKSSFKNLPSGESCLGPVESTANGIFIVDASFLEKVDSPITVKVENGFAVDIKGGKTAEKLKKVLKDVGHKHAYAIAELGIGTNDCATVTGNILEDEKVLGTAHIALGNNLSYGGNIDVPIHLDGVFLEPTIYVDDVKIMEKGKLLI